MELVFEIHFPKLPMYLKKERDAILPIHLLLSIYEPNICNFTFVDSKYHK